MFTNPKLIAPFQIALISSLRGSRTTAEQEENQQHRYWHADQPKQDPPNFALLGFLEVIDLHTTEVSADAGSLRVVLFAEPCDECGTGVKSALWRSS
jgi:hypothetical protein